MAGESGSGGIDPRLIEGFALFREPGPDGPLDADDQQIVASRTEVMAAAPRLRERVAPLGLIFGEVRKVILDSARIVLVIPGRAGLYVVVRDAECHSASGGSASIEACLEGQPLLSLDQTLVGLAPDGVDRQLVEFCDGSTGYAPLRHNVYAIHDPTRHAL